MYTPKWPHWNSTFYRPWPVDVAISPVGVWRFMGVYHSSLWPSGNLSTNLLHLRWYIDMVYIFHNSLEFPIIFMPWIVQQNLYTLNSSNRHPDPSQRPTFRDITELLSVEDEHLLTWQEAWHITGEACRSNQSSNQANLTTSEVTQYASIQNQLIV